MIDFLGRDAKQFFKEMLDDVGPSVTLGGIEYKAGNVLINMHPDQFEELYEDFLNRCREKKVLIKTRSGLVGNKERWNSETTGDLTIIRKALDIVKEMEI